MVIMTHWDMSLSNKMSDLCPILSEDESVFIQRFENT